MRLKWMSQSQRLFDSKERTEGKHEVPPDLRIWYFETALVWFCASFIQNIKIFGVPATVASPLIVILIASVVFKKSQYEIRFPWKAETEPPIHKPTTGTPEWVGIAHGSSVADALMVHSPCESSPELVSQSFNITKSTSVAQDRNNGTLKFGIRHLRPSMVFHRDCR
jgi:hypothetical protein